MLTLEILFSNMVLKYHEKKYQKWRKRKLYIPLNYHG